MMTIQGYGINHYNKNNFIHIGTFFPSKIKPIKLEDKMGIYFNNHPLAFWAVSLVGIPIGILLTVGLAATVFGLIMLGVISLL